jgi:hypothetical protein
MQISTRVVTLVLPAALAASSACSSGRGTGRPTPAPAPNASRATARNATADTMPCAAAVRGIDVSSWRMVVEKEFTLCLPPGWQGRGGGAHQGRTTINWGTGTPRAQRVAIVTKTVVRAGQRPLPPELPPGSETYQFLEDIGGRSAQLYRNRLNGTYYVGATWQTAGVWLNGDTTEMEGADLILAIARTVRFPTR